MKRKQTANSWWGLIAIVAVGYVGTIVAMKCGASTGEESTAAAVAAHSPKRKSAPKAAPAKHKHVAQRRSVDAGGEPPLAGREIAMSAASAPPAAPAELSEPSEQPAAEPMPAPQKAALPLAPPPQDTPQAEAVMPFGESVEAWRVRNEAVWSLNEAAVAGDLAVCLARIGEGEPVSAADEQGNTPLHLAAAAGHDKVALALLENGADPMAENKEGKRPAEVASTEAARAACEEGEKPRRKELALFTAVREGRVGELQLALKAGVNPNALSGDNAHSLLTAAVIAGQVEAARVLLKAGAEVNYVEPSSRTALNHAAGGGNVEMVQMLLNAGADPMMHTNHGAYPIHDAIWSGRTAAAVLLVPYYKSVGYNPDGRGNGYPATMAIGRGNVEVLKALLAAGLNPNDPVFAKEPLLVMAAKGNRLEMARVLLKAGADKRAKDATGKKAADYAKGDLLKLLK